MCGFIAGKNIGIDLNTKDISYRGLDGYDGYYRKDNIQLAHQSLPFVNLNKNIAIQPYFNKKNVPFMLVGEIFNYKNFGDYKNDTEAISDVFEKKGLEGFHLFDGFWSFVTVINNHIFAATDYLSQKPIYYRTDLEILSSEIDILKKYGKLTPNHLFLSNVLKWGYDPRPETPWNEIKQIPPGCYYYKGQIYTYWDWDKVDKTNLKKDLFDSTNNRLNGKRDVSLLFSGGLDSTIIYSLIKQSKNKIKLIHVENNEIKWVNSVLNFYKSYDDLVLIKNENISTKESLIIHQSPVDLGSVKPQISMAKKLKEIGFYTTLTGDGADELFGGYKRSALYDSQFSDIFMELPYYHLPKLDRTMMRFTIESRSPFLSPKIISHALTIPHSKRNGEKKVLKELFKNDIPKIILNRDKKPLKNKHIEIDCTKQRILNNKTWKKLYVA